MLKIIIFDCTGGRGRQRVVSPSYARDRSSGGAERDTWSTQTPGRTTTARPQVIRLKFKDKTYEPEPEQRQVQDQSDIHRGTKPEPGSVLKHGQFSIG